MTVIFLLLMLVGTFTLGLGDVLRRKYLNEGIHEQVFLVIALFLSGILIFPTLLVTGFPEIKSEFWPAFFTTVLVNLVSQNLFIKAFKLTEASLIAPLRLIIPPLVILTGFIFLNEKPSIFGVLGIVLTMIGLWVLLNGKQVSKSLIKRWINDKGIRYGLLGSVLFAISYPFDKITVVNSSALFATFLVFTSLGVVTFLIQILIDKKFGITVYRSFRSNFDSYIYISILSCIGLVLTNQALNYSLAVYASSLKRLQAVWTVLIAGKYLNEKELGKRMFATILMFLGICFSIFIQ